MKTSNHASMRVRKRVGIKKKAVDKMRDVAYSRGVCHSIAKGRLRKYFDFLYLSHRRANNIRMYANYVWIFCGEVLVTVFPIPHNYIAAAIKLNRG